MTARRALKRAADFGGKRVSLPMPEALTTAKGRENLKYQALCQYETALEPDAVEFLMAFIKDEEVFWKLQ